MLTARLEQAGLLVCTSLISAVVAPALNTSSRPSAVFVQMYRRPSNPFSLVASELESRSLTRLPTESSTGPSRITRALSMNSPSSTDAAVADWYSPSSTDVSGSGLTSSSLTDISAGGLNSPSSTHAAAGFPLPAKLLRTMSTCCRFQRTLIILNPKNLWQKRHELYRRLINMISVRYNHEKLQMN